MKIILSPLASNYTTLVSVSGFTITIDGQAVDLSVIPEGGYAEPDDESPFVGKVMRNEVTVIYHYDTSLAESNQSANWDDYTFEVTEGEVPCPIVWKEQGEQNV
jgi:hypothetical protein